MVRDGVSVNWAETVRGWLVGGELATTFVGCTVTYWLGPLIIPLGREQLCAPISREGQANWDLLVLVF